MSDKAIKLMKLGLPTPLGCLLPADSEEYTDSEDENSSFISNKSLVQSCGESSLSKLINTQLINFDLNPWGYFPQSESGQHSDSVEEDNCVIADKFLFSVQSAVSPSSRLSSLNSSRTCNECDFLELKTDEL